MTSDSTILHATTISVAGRGVLITGPSGSGQSSLALDMLTRGATLVADDRTMVTRSADHLMADVPEPIAGMIEARGVGLIKVPASGPVPLALAVDMGREEVARLPEPHQFDLMGITLPCLHRVDTPHFASAILLYTRGNI